LAVNLADTRAFHLLQAEIDAHEVEARKHKDEVGGIRVVIATGIGVWIGVGAWAGAARSLGFQQAVGERSA
jgi:hypothetical protein